MLALHRIRAFEVGRTLIVTTLAFIHGVRFSFPCTGLALDPVVGALLTFRPAADQLTLDFASLRSSGSAHRPAQPSIKALGYGSAFASGTDERLLKLA